MKFTPAVRRRVEKAKKKFTNDLYFNPRKRAEMRADFIKSRDLCLAKLRRPVGLATPYSEMVERSRTEDFADIMAGFIDLIDNIVPKALESWKLYNTHFEMYQQIDGRLIIYKTEFDKGKEREHGQNHLIIPKGLPKRGSKTKATLVKGNYAISNCRLVDQGTFTQINKCMESTITAFKGKNKTVRLKLSRRTKGKDDYWIKMLK